MVLDCVAEDSTAKICADAIGSGGGKYCALLDVPCPRSDVESTFFLGYSMTGEAYIFEGHHYPAAPADLEFSRKWAEAASKLWRKGLWKEHPLDLRGSGFQGVIEGMREMKKKGTSGIKLVYKVADTEWPATTLDGL